MNNGENQFTCFSCDHSLCLKCVTETAIYKKYKVPKIPDRKEKVRPITWPTVNQVTCLVPLITSSSYLFILAFVTSPSSPQHTSDYRCHADTLPSHICTTVITIVMQIPYIAIICAAVIMTGMQIP